jgi:hypothetical protein
LRNHFLRVWAALLMFGLFAGIVGQSAGVLAQTPTGVEATPGLLVYPSSFDGDVRDLPQSQLVPTTRWHPSLTAAPAASKFALGASVFDAAMEAAPAQPAVMPAPSATFSGLSFLDKCPSPSGPQCGRGYPPDTVGDVGHMHYIQSVNTAVGIYTKTGTLLASFSYENFWVGAGTGTACDGNTTTPRHMGDPTVLYDAGTGRWIFSDFAWSNFVDGPYYQCFAASKTTDPVGGGWWLYAVQASPTILADYPKVGLWSDGIYMSANMFDITDAFGNATRTGVRVWALNKSDMESGAGLRNFSADLNATYFSLLPANVRGAMPPVGRGNFFVSNDINVYRLNVWQYTVNAAWSSAVFSGPTSVTQVSYGNPPNTVPESGGNSLDTIGDRLMMQNQYRNFGGTESLWVTHIVGNPPGIRWYQINISGGIISTTPVQQATFTNSNDGLSRWIPSLAVDHDGNMAVGYSVSSSGMKPAIRWAGRLATDAVGTLAQGEATMFAGAGAQTNNCGGAPCTRWGDYSAMSIDPVDDCTFWYTNEYYATDGGNWNTRIGKFKYAGCPLKRLYLPVILR